jgi:hypothetical protein
VEVVEIVPPLRRIGKFRSTNETGSGKVAGVMVLALVLVGLVLFEGAALRYGYDSRLWKAPALRSDWKTSFAGIWRHEICPSGTDEPAYIAGMSEVNR